MTIKQFGKILAALLFCCANNLWALPTGPEVLSGSASFVTEGKTLTIEISGKTIIQWRSFDIAKDETVRFVQDSSGSVDNRSAVASISGSILYDGNIIFSSNDLSINDETFIKSTNKGVTGSLTFNVGEIYVGYASSTNAQSNSTYAAGTITSSIRPSGSALDPAPIGSATVIQPPKLIDPNVSAHIAFGWNLLGNTVELSIDAASKFNDPNKIYSIWKWLPTGTTPGIVYPAWAFYSPQLADGGKAYAKSKGYEFLTTIDVGEGFWVNAATEHTLMMSGFLNISPPNFKPAAIDPPAPGGWAALPRGWSLIATSDSPTPAQFAAAVTTTSTRLSSLWAWDASLSKWYFWTPEMDSDALKNYNQSKGYLDFSAKTLSPSTGFWVNRP